MPLSAYNPDHGTRGNHLGRFQRGRGAAAAPDPRPAHAGGAVGQRDRRVAPHQPQASKHLRVLREVDLVSVRDSGKQRLYRLNGEGLKPIHDWVRTYERYWNETFDRLAGYLDKLQTKEKDDERNE
jgi:hypothetical protein